MFNFLRSKYFQATYREPFKFMAMHSVAVESRTVLNANILALPNIIQMMVIAYEGAPHDEAQLLVESNKLDFSITARRELIKKNQLFLFPPRAVLVPNHSIQNDFSKCVNQALKLLGETEMIINDADKHDLRSWLPSVSL